MELQSAIENPNAGGCSLERLVRHQVYRSKGAKTYLCVAAARNKRHALKIARQLFRLDRTAYATLAPEIMPGWM